MKFAAIDIGSNAVRLLLARVIAEGRDPVFKKEALVRMPLRLGEDAFRTGAISKDKADRLVATMEGFKHLMTAYPAHDFAAYATSALREARNGAALVDRVRRSTGIAIEIIDGRREAEVIYANHIERHLDRKSTYLYIDVGGGSTELTLTAGGRQVASASFPIGTVRMLQGRVTRKTMDSLKEWVQSHRDEYGRATAIGSGGNINTLFKLARISPGKPLPVKRFNEIHAAIDAFTLEERITVLGLKPDRADVIGHAAEIFHSVMKWGRVRKILVPQVGLSDGIVHLLYEKHRRRRIARTRARRAR